jgi:Alpha/beta hydrolase family
MNGNYFYVLIHSPLVGGLTWALVAERMRHHGQSVIIPTLSDSTTSKEPFWRQHAESVSQALIDVPQQANLILVAHSGAGPLLPAIRQSIPNPIRAYVFVDAGIPRDGATRLDMMKSEDSEWAEQFEKKLRHGAHFPDWSSEDLREIIPDETLREKLVAEIHPRRLDFFTEPIPVFPGWPDAPCVYILFSPPYTKVEMLARQNGWRTYKMEAGHFHMLVDAGAVADIIMKSIHESAV